MMSSNCQYWPCHENRSFDVHALVMMSIDSSNRGSASSIGMRKPTNSIMPVAFADAEIQSPARQQIDRCRLLGEQYRIVPGQHDHGGAEA